MDIAEETEIAKHSIATLITAADHYAHSLPSFAAHLMSEAEQMKTRLDFNPTPKQRVCSGCGSLFRPGNHHARCAPRTKPNKKLLKLQRKQQAGTLTGRFQQRLLERFKASTSKAVLHCDICRKKTVLACQSKPTKITAKDTESETQESVIITKSMKKKQKRRKRRLELSVLSDSGLDLSLDSTRAGVPTLTSTPISSMPKKMPGFHSTTSSADHPFSSLYSSYMSSNRSQNLSSTGQDTSNLTNTSNLSTTSDENVSGSKRTNNKKARSKLKNNQLQQLLLKEKKKKEKAQSSSLHSFLASL